MGTIHMTGDEVTNHFATVIEKVGKGIEVVVEQDDRPVAVIRAPNPRGRLLSECIALAEARCSGATLDEGFMNDVDEGVAQRSLPWNPSSWE